jgi:hypothetical protein
MTIKFVIAWRQEGQKLNVPSLRSMIVFYLTFFSLFLFRLLSFLCVCYFVSSISLARFRLPIPKGVDIHGKRCRVIDSRKRFFGINFRKKARFEDVRLWICHRVGGRRQTRRRLKHGLSDKLEDNAVKKCKIMSMLAEMEEAKLGVEKRYRKAKPTDRAAGKSILFSCCSFLVA